MFELTNEQRKCFGLQPIENSWIRIEPMNSPAWATVIAYLDGTVIRKYIETGNCRYMEYEVNEQLTDDLRYLLPKTSKGKPVLLSASSLEKRTGFGMCLSYLQHRTDLPSNISLYSLSSQKGYYYSEYDPVYIPDITAFQHWVERWCSETTQDDLRDIAMFAAQPRQHVKFREGDVFRFKMNRRLYGYGRILVDYDCMRKNKEPFWNIMMGKPLACSVYHVATERKDVSVEELRQCNALPSVHMMDNRLYYGEYEIIGNIPIGEHEDYPIMYGNSISLGERAVLLQCGKLHRKYPGKEAVAGGFHNNSIGFGLGFRRSELQECIEAGSNAPYWAQEIYKVNHDLRNPKFRKDLERVCKQFGLSPSQLIK